MEWLTFQQNKKPAPRWGHSAFVQNKKLFIFGGYSDSQYRNDLWEFSPELNQWSEIKLNGLLPESRSNHHLLEDTNTQKVYLHGGGGNNKQRFGDVWQLDLISSCWTQVQCKGIQNQPRTYHGACIGQGYLMVYGGENGQDLDSLEVLDLAQMKWIPVDIEQNNSIPGCRRFCTLNYINNETCDNFGQLVLLGGCLPNYVLTPSIYIADLKLSNKQMYVNWTKLVHRQFHRWGHSAVVFKNNIWICGGRNQTEDIMDICHFNLSDGQIKQIPTTNKLIPRRKHTGQIIGNSVIIFGGFKGEYLDDTSFIEIKEKHLYQLENYACSDIKLIDLFKSFDISFTRHCFFVEISNQNFEKLLKEMIMTEVFFTKIAKLFQNFWDIVLVTCDGIEIQCNEQILREKSNFFRALLSNQYQDSTGFSIKLDLIQADHLLPILVYMYTGYIILPQILDSQEILNLLILSNYLDIQPLSYNLRYIIDKKINQLDVNHLYKYALIYQDNYLQQACSNKLAESNDIYQTKGLNILNDITNVQQEEWIQQTMNKQIQISRELRYLPLIYKKHNQTNEKKKTFKNSENKEN